MINAEMGIIGIYMANAGSQAKEKQQLEIY
jgi:hypothetical protein